MVAIDIKGKAASEVKGNGAPQAGSESPALYRADSKFVHGTSIPKLSPTALHAAARTVSSQLLGLTGQPAQPVKATESGHSRQLEPDLPGIQEHAAATALPGPGDTVDLVVRPLANAAAVDSWLDTRRPVGSEAAGDISRRDGAAEDTQSHPLAPRPPAEAKTTTDGHSPRAQRAIADAHRSIQRTDNPATAGTASKRDVALEAEARAVRKDVSNDLWRRAIAVNFLKIKRATWRPSPLRFEYVRCARVTRLRYHAADSVSIASGPRCAARQ